jgi:hypothetical protein
MAPFSPFYDILCGTNAHDPIHVCELAAARDWWAPQPEVSLLQLSQASTKGCPACGLNLQALLICIPELEDSLQHSVSAQSFSISPIRRRSNDDVDAVSYRVHSEGMLRLSGQDGFRIFTPKGE